MSDEAVAWLREQIEITKRAASPKILRDGGPWHIDNRHWEAGTGIIDAGGHPVAVAIGDYAAVHIARHDPLDVMADCEAKLAILDVHAVRSHYCPLPSLASTHGQLWTPDEGRCWTLHLLASAYQHRRGHAEHWPAPVSN